MKIKEPGIVLLIMFTTCLIHIQGQESWLASPESINQFRNQVESMRPSPSKYEIDTEDILVDLGDRQIMVRKYGEGGNSNKPGLIYIHGACWVAGSLNSHDEICRYLALKGGVVVFAIDYRLAPENKFPAGHDDVYEVSKWIYDHSDVLGIKKDKVALAGESTGAYFSNATALRLLDEGAEFKPLFQLLVYAAVDGGGSSWSPCKNNYFTSVEESRSRYGSPLWQDDLGGMPPTYNIFGEFEISRSEEELYIRKLKDNKVPTKSFMHQGVGHDVMSWLTVSEETPAHLKAVEYLGEGFK